MKVILLLSFIIVGGHRSGVETLRFDMPDLAHCESVAENLKEIYSIDPAFSQVDVSTNCVEMP